uniref:Uncharacterized protein n=1 Tax=Melopsittacus undulatus TaxID=13146 RepID=A0A8C6NAV3_MELUD
MDLQLADIRSEQELWDGDVREDGAPWGVLWGSPWWWGAACRAKAGSQCAGNTNWTPWMSLRAVGPGQPHNSAPQHRHGSGPLPGNTEGTSPAMVSAVPGWGIALLVLVCILLLLSILACLLLVSPHPHPSCGGSVCPSRAISIPTPFLSPQTICACRRKTRGKLDLFSTKDSYHPMAEYLQYQSHGRYVSPSSKPNPYSQVAGSNGAGTGTFTYTNPSATSDNL